MQLVNKSLALILFVVLVGIPFSNAQKMIDIPKVKIIKGDPLNVQTYTLSNGMQLMMSINTKEPRIQTNIAVRAGSKHDPADATGLAHYLEHMMFKGTNKIAALNWEQESKLLQQISDLYEKHRNTTDPEQRKAIYAEIDKVSNDAAKLVAANEYDKVVSSIGAKGTNAYTWVEQTVYINDIPTNELERWMKLESERFRMCVLRLFHTELEAVYEEFNINQDRDFRKANKAIMETLFPTHPYGLQTTIGRGEHLKNPSHEKIQEYFNTYYKPNNMAIVLSGDFDPKAAIAMAEQYFGTYKSGEVPPFKYEEQAPLTKRVEKEVFGQEPPFLEMAWRFDGAKSEETPMVELMKGILFNGKVGVLDRNINQKQLLLDAYAWTRVYEDYSIFGLSGEPTAEQSMKDVEEILLQQIADLKAGNFDESIIAAYVRNAKYKEMVANQSNSSRARIITTAFVTGLPWESYVNRYDVMSKITKEEVIAFANKYLNDNYVVVHKKNGEDKSNMKVDKPSITPVSLNRKDQSPFSKALMAEKTPALKPVFVDYSKDIQQSMIQGGKVRVDYVANRNNPTFELRYTIEMGSNSDKILPIAVSYLPYLGTADKSSEALKNEFYQLGLSFDVYSGEERVYVILRGLDESFEAGVALLEEYLANVKADEEALKKMVQSILEQRDNNKKDKRYVLRNALTNYAIYGKNSAFLNKISAEELNALESGSLIKVLKQLTSYEHNVFYYGSLAQEKVNAVLDEMHQTPEKLMPLPALKKYVELDTKKDEVLFVEFPMVQAEVIFFSKGTPTFNKEEYLMSEWYNTYFGYGLSSIVFQEIRESRALAYSSYAYYGSPRDYDKAHRFQAYIGTQANKLTDAIPALMEIINEMPVAEDQIETARNSILKKIETERTVGQSIYSSYLAAQRRKLDSDITKEVYEKIQSATMDELLAFQKEHIKNRKYTILVMGSKESIGEAGMEYLKNLGDFKELSLEEIFGY